MTELMPAPDHAVSALPEPEHIRACILRLEAEMMALPDHFDKDCKQFPVRHYRAPGMIGREMFIPKGSIIIGKIHKHAHLNLISVGHVRVVTEDGPMEIRAPYTFTSSVGAKRVVTALEDTIWTTFHLNPNELDPESEADMRQLENEIIATSYEDVPHLTVQKTAIEVAA